MNAIDEKTLHRILSCFSFDTEPVSCEPYGCGHINLTYLVVSAEGRRYILQRMNEHVTKSIPDLMKNIDLVTKHLRKTAKEARNVLNLVATKDGQPYLAADSGYWRVYDFVEDSICLQTPEKDQDFYESAVAFGHLRRS